MTWSEHQPISGLQAGRQHFKGDCRKQEWKCSCVQCVVLMLRCTGSLKCRFFCWCGLSSLSVTSPAAKRPQSYPKKHDSCPPNLRLQSSVSPPVPLLPSMATDTDSLPLWSCGQFNERAKDVVVKPSVPNSMWVMAHRLEILEQPQRKQQI